VVGDLFFLHDANGLSLLRHILLHAVLQVYTD
jgi:2-succinyl-5-enolpyruvyl-6-hydroxy-3-cyclohexene-1-carboxylate synthase